MGVMSKTTDIENTYEYLVRGTTEEPNE